MDNFSSRFQSLIDGKNISQADFCEATGFNKSQISRMLSGDIKSPHRKTIVKIADFFGSDPDWLEYGKLKNKRKHVENATEIVRTERHQTSTAGQLINDYLRMTETIFGTLGSEVRILSSRP